MRVIFSIVLLFFLISLVRAVDPCNCLPPNQLPFRFHPPDLGTTYNVSCRICGSAGGTGTCQSFFQIPANGLIDVVKLINANPADTPLCLRGQTLQLQCVQGNGDNICYGGAHVTMPPIVFQVYTDPDTGYCMPKSISPILTPNYIPGQTDVYFYCAQAGTPNCIIGWNVSSVVNSTNCNPVDTSSPTPIVSPTVTPTVSPHSSAIPIGGGPTDTPTSTPTDTPTPTSDVSNTPTGGSGGNSGGGGGTYYTEPSITTCNAHFPFLDDYSCTIINLETKEITALTLCNSNKNFACTSRWNMPGNLKCGNNYQISCSKNNQCFKDLQLKDFKILFTATCNPSSRIEGCVLNGDCVLNKPYHKTETFISSNFDSTYCGFSRVLEKSTFCSVNNDEFLKKGPVTANLSTNLVPFSNSLLNNVFESSKKEVGVGNNSFDQNAKKGSQVNNSDLQFAGVNDQLVKIRSNSNTELDKLSSTFQFLLYKLLPILGVLGVIGLVVFLVRKRKLVVFRVASKSIPISNANVMISVNDKTYSETTDYRGYVTFHLPIEENTELKVQAFVSVNNIKLVSKLYEVEYDSTKEIQELLVFDEKSIVSS